jgi:hypothetical protein
MPQRRIMNPRYVIRSDLVRRPVGSVRCPLGVFPCERGASLREGYETHFHTAEDELGDQYEYRLLVSADRLFDTAKQLFELLIPEEAYATYEEFSLDAYRENDAFMSDDVVPRDRILLAWERYGDYLVEDGKCGFGALSFDPQIEIFVEEHGSIFIACALEQKARVEEIIHGLRLEHFETLKCIENYRHQHEDVLLVDPNDSEMMDEVDIKFSIIESLGMRATNLLEGEPAPVPCMYWAHVELDLAFTDKKEGMRKGAFSCGMTAENHDDALVLIDLLALRHPGALISRIVELYRITEEDLNDEVAPRDRQELAQRGTWFVGDLQTW